MNTDIKVSIIVPVYNGEEFLRETLDCITKQTLTDIEILCVDDESTDTSVQIIEEYRQQDARIILYKNQKSNAGAARNFALERAKGKYLLFWDADDLYDLQAAELLYQQMEQDNADIGVCNADHYDTEKGIYISRPQYLKKSFLPETIPFSKDTNGKYILNFSAQVAWNKMFSRDFVERNHIRFQEIPRINDHYFVSVSLVLAERITIVDKKLVHYRINQKDNLTGTSSDSPLCKYEVQCEIKKKFLELNLMEDREIRQSFINKALNTMIHGLNIQNNVDGYRTLYDKFKQEGLEYLELTGYEEDYYYNKLEYRNLLLIQELEYDGYLVQKGIDYRKNIEEKKLAIEKHKIAIEKHKQRIKKLEKQLEDIKNRKWYKLGEKVLPIYAKILRK